MNKKQERHLKAASFSVMALCFTSLMVFLSQHQKSLKSDQAMAMKRIEIYATRLIESKFKTTLEKVSSPRRGLASVSENSAEVLEGPVGLDPWGYTFNFLVKKDSKNPNAGTLIIWSRGKNNKFETTSDMLAEKPHHFNGDDFGMTKAFSL